MFRKIRTLLYEKKEQLRYTYTEIKPEQKRIVSVPETKPEVIKQVKKFYTVLIYESIAKRPTNVLKRIQHNRFYCGILRCVIYLNTQLENLIH